MNPTNTQPKPAKRLALNKETIRHLTTTEGTNRDPGVSVGCTAMC
jgi:hypothetical protein